MKTKVRVETQVEEFVKALASDPRRRLRLAIRALADDSGDLKSLEGSLAGFSRLRISGYPPRFGVRPFVAQRSPELAQSVAR